MAGLAAGMEGGAMRVLMFHKRFIQSLQNGTKRHTIRERTRCKVGESLSLRYWSAKAYRSPQSVIGLTSCESISPIVIEVRPMICDLMPLSIEIAGILIHPENLDDFARSDGFRDAQDMANYYRDNRVEIFEGVMIEFTRLVRCRAVKPC